MRQGREKKIICGRLYAKWLGPPQRLVGVGLEPGWRCWASLLIRSGVDLHFPPARSEHGIPHGSHWLPATEPIEFITR